MSNPTTPFGWQMPTNTDLVTDLPADFEVFGQAVATSMADLLGGTSGQVLAKNSNTDMDFVWTDANPGDITGITATSPLTGGGTSGAVTVGIQAASTTQTGAVQLTDSTSSTSTTTAATPNSVKSSYDLAAAAIPKSTVTTSGDVIYATGSSAVTRLGIGSTGQVLTVAAGIPSWATPSASASGLTLVKAQTIGTTVSSVNVTSAFSSTYDNYRIIISGGVVNGSDAQLNLKLGSTATGYYTLQIYGNYSGNTLTGGGQSNGTSFAAAGGATAGSITATIDLQNPNAAKNTHYASNYAQSNTAAGPAWVLGYLANTTQYTDFTITPSTGTLTGGTIRVYGYQNS
jgi:hypothetical protein